jgi:hypothetical protein
VAVAGCGGDDGPPRRVAPLKVPALEFAPPAPSGGLAVGLSEFNANLFWHDRDVGPLGPWRDRAEALRPSLFRLLVDWSALQPSPRAPVNWAVPQTGCVREVGPCHPFAGILDELRAIHSEQAAGNGFATMVVVYGVPAWAAAPASGCARDDIGPRSRPINAAGLAGYRALIRSLQGVSRLAGVSIGWWAPWNEPNGPFFISPQRTRCDGGRLRSAALYARLARAMRSQLRPGQQLVIGELAGLEDSGSVGTSIGDFVDALPGDVLCSAGVYSQHAYAKRGDDPSDAGAVGQLEGALDRRPCTNGKPIWVTETGIGGPHVGDERTGGAPELRADCRVLDATLRRWDADPRVDAAFQYTFRDDPAFPVGLADARLDTTFPTYELWKAWGGERAPDGPPPGLPAACSG